MHVLKQYPRPIVSPISIHVIYFCGYVGRLQLIHTSVSGCTWWKASGFCRYKYSKPIYAVGCFITSSYHSASNTYDVLPACLIIESANLKPKLHAIKFIVPHKIPAGAPGTVAVKNIRSKTPYTQISWNIVCRALCKSLRQFNDWNGCSGRTRFRYIWVSDEFRTNINHCNLLLLAVMARPKVFYFIRLPAISAILHIHVCENTHQVLLGEATRLFGCSPRVCSFFALLLLAGPK